MSFKLRYFLTDTAKNTKGEEGSFLSTWREVHAKCFLSLSYQGSLLTKVVSSTLPALRPHNPYWSSIQGVWFGQNIHSAELSALEKSKSSGDPQPPKKHVVMQRRATPAKKSQVCFYLWKTFQQLLREACLVACIILTETPSPAWRALSWGECVSMSTKQPSEHSATVLHQVSIKSSCAQPIMKWM